MTNNPTEQQATPTSEEELREKIELTLDEWSFLPGLTHIEECGYWGTDDGQGSEFCDCIYRREVDVWPKCLDELMQLLHQYGNTREIEGRIDELKKTGGPNDAYENIGHLLASNVKERINELTKAKETPHET